VPHVLHVRDGAKRLEHFNDRASGDRRKAGVKTRGKAAGGQANVAAAAHAWALHLLGYFDVEAADKELVGQVLVLSGVGGSSRSGKAGAVSCP